MKTKLVILIFTLLGAGGSLFAQDFVQSYNFINTGTNGPANSFANTGVTSFFIQWSPQTTVFTCAVQVDSSADGISWGNGDLIASQNCSPSATATVSSSGPTPLAAGKFFIRIHVTALTGNGGVNVTLKGWGGASGGGISSVSSLPATCTPGVTAPVQLSIPPYGVFPCGPTANNWLGNGNFQVDPRSFGAKEDVQFAFGNTASIAITSGSPNVTVGGAGFCNGTTVPCTGPFGSDVGKVFNATNWCCNTSVAASTTATTMVPANTTILSVTDSTHVVLSANATGTCTTTCAVAWATDDTTAQTAVSTFISTYPACVTVHFVGFSLTKSGQFNTSNTDCEKRSAFTDVAGGHWITGEAMAGSGIYVDGASFNYGSCTGNNGVVSNACFLAAIAGGTNFTIFGLGFSGAGRTDNVTAVAPFNFDSAASQGFTNVAFLDWMGGDPGTGIGNNVGFFLLRAHFLMYGLSGLAQWLANMAGRAVLSTRLPLAVGVLILFIAI